MQIISDDAETVPRINQERVFEGRTHTYRNTRIALSIRLTANNEANANLAIP